MYGSYKDGIKHSDWSEFCIVPQDIVGGCLDNVVQAASYDWLPIIDLINPSGCATETTKGIFVLSAVFNSLTHYDSS